MKNFNDLKWIILLCLFQLNEGVKIIDRSPAIVNSYANGFGYNNGRSQRPYSQRQTGPNSYRVSQPKPKKPLNRVPVFLQDVEFNSAGLTGSDAIRIVEPPLYFQEQKTRFQKSPSHKQPQYYDPYGSYYNNVKPQQAKLVKANRPYKLPGRQEYESSYTGPEYAPSASSSNLQHIPYPENNHNSQHVSRPPPPKYTAHHAIVISHPKPTPTYFGIQTPSSDSLKSQVQQFKEYQKHLFEDETDQRPVRQKPTKLKQKKKATEQQNYLSNYTPLYNSQKYPQKPFGKYQNDYDIVHYDDNNFDTKYKRPGTSYIKQSIPNEPEASYQSESKYQKHLLTNPIYVPSQTNYDDGEIEYKKKVKKPAIPRDYSQAYAVVEHTTPEIETSTFTPYRLLASVRNRQRTAHKPKDPYEESAKERLKTQKTQTVYSEQGFEDLEYDHDDEQRQGKRKKKIRQRREANKNFRKSLNESSASSEEPIIEQIEELPVALNMVSSTGEQLSGRALLQHISQLLKNTSKFFPDETNDDDADSIILHPEELEELFQQPVNFTLTHPDVFDEPNENYPYKTKLNFNASGDAIETIKASPYRKYNSFACDEVQPNFEQNDQKKKLGNLGSHLDCLKDQLFGKDPFSNRFFGTSSGKFILSNDNKTPIPTSFPSSTVYDDVMQTIRTALHNEIMLANQKETKFKGISPSTNTTNKPKTTPSIPIKLRHSTVTLKKAALSNQNLANDVRISPPPLPKKIHTTSKTTTFPKNPTTKKLLTTKNNLSPKITPPLLGPPKSSILPKISPRSTITSTTVLTTTPLPKTKKRRTHVVEISSRKNIGRNYKNIETSPIDYSDPELISSTKKIRRKKKVQPFQTALTENENENLEIFDVTKYIPKAYMIRPDGKIFRIKYRPMKKLTALMRKPVADKKNLRKRIHHDDMIRNKLMGNRRTITLPVHQAKERSSIISPETEKFSHENGMNRYLAEQRFRT